MQACDIFFLPTVLPFYVDRLRSTCHNASMINVDKHSIRRVCKLCVILLLFTDHVIRLGHTYVCCAGLTDLSF